MSAASPGPWATTPSTPTRTRRTTPASASSRAPGCWRGPGDRPGPFARPPPFWAFAGPGGRALARYLPAPPATVAGRRVLDVGAGCGIGALAAARAGAAPAIAADIDQFAIAAIALNAALNDLAVTITAADVLATPPAADIVLLGDMCYERPLAES